MERKKFEIGPIVTPPKKKFEIIPPKKKFEIKTQEGENIKLEWFRQTNANDCGPCLLLNGLHRIENVRHIPHDIAEVRREVNRLRRESQRPELGPSDWFTSEDIGKYLSEVAGLNVEEYVCFRDVAEETEREIGNSLRQNSFDMIYSTAGRHFKGIIPSEDHYELLDSFNSAPSEQTAESINEMIGRSVYGTTRGSMPMRFGIIRRGEPVYTVKAF